MIITITPPPVYTITVGAAQGPPGPPGAGTDPDALHVTQRLAEFNTPTAKQQARANLELDVIDCGTFN